MMMKLFEKSKLVLGIGALFLVSLFGPWVLDISAELPDVINIATNVPGNKTHAIDLKIANGLSEYLGKPVKAIPFSKDRPRLEALMKGEVQWVNIAVAAADQAMKGIAGYSDPGWRPLQFRMMQHTVKIPVTMMVRGDSKINSLSELKGKKIGYIPGWPPYTIQAKAFLAFAGISADEVVWVPFPSGTKCIEGVGTGQIDASSGSLITLTVIRLFSSPVSLKFLPAPEDDKEGWKRFAQFISYPHGVWEYGICKGKPLDVAIGSYYYAVLAEHSEDDVYTLAKALFETYPKYKDFMFPDTTFFSLEETLKLKNWELAKVAYHAGFIKYAKEKGLWTAAHEEYQKKALEAEKIRLSGKYRRQEKKR